MTASVLFGRKAAKIGLLQLDATVNESHDYINEVTQYPTEDGSTATDNIRKLPERITIQGIISDRPIEVEFNDVTDIINDENSNQPEARFVSRDDTPTRIETAQNILLRISGRVLQGNPVRPELVTVVTGLRVYTNMALVNLNISRNGRTGRALPFSAEFMKIETTELAFIDPQDGFSDKASTKLQKGKQTTSAPKSEPAVSKIKSFYNSVTKRFN